MGGELAAVHHGEQGGSGVGVDQAGGDRDVLAPQRLQVKGRRLAVDADVRHATARPDQAGTELEAFRHTNRLDGDVGAQTVAQLRDDVSRGSVAESDGDICAKTAGRLQPAGGRVDRDDVGRAEQAGGGDGSQADGSRSHDYNGVGRRPGR